MVCLNFADHRYKHTGFVMESFFGYYLWIMRILITILLVASGYLPDECPTGRCPFCRSASLGQGSILPSSGWRYQPLARQSGSSRDAGPAEVRTYVVSHSG